MEDVPFIFTIFKQMDIPTFFVSSDSVSFYGKGQCSE